MTVNFQFQRGPRYIFFQGTVHRIKVLLHLSQNSPLLLAATYGHATCVSMLLSKGANVKEKPADSEDGYKLNCLMIAAKRKHRYIYKVRKYIHCCGQFCSFSLCEHCTCIYHT